jgi:putative ABC transport system permease protein
VLSDLKNSFRQLAKDPGFTAVAILTLALGIGACTAIFSVVDSILLRPMPYPESERLVVLRESIPPETPVSSVAPGNYRAWEAGTTAFEGIYAQRNASFNLTGRGDPVRISALRATGQYFTTLRTAPLLGRTFGPGDDQPGRDTVVVLTYGFWQKHFAGSPDALGATLRLNGTPHTVIGVMPATFQVGARHELYAPLAFTAEENADHGAHYLAAGARLKPGVTIAEASAQLNAVAARLAQEFPDTNKNWIVTVRSLLEQNTAPVRATLYTLLAAVGVLLLIACANVANLLLARSTRRQREMSIRAALGASRWRVARQLLTESLVLALGGGVLGTLVGYWGLDALLAFAPTDLPRVAEITLDGRILAVTLGLTLLTGVVFGLAPAWHASKVDLVDALKQGARGSSDGGSRHLMRHGLVVLEIALALMLLTGAGLLVRSFARLADFDPGFDPRNAVFVSVAVPELKYGPPAAQSAFVDSVLERFRAQPGVIAAGATHVMPMGGSDYVLGLEIEGRDIPLSDLPETNYFAVTPDYFKAAGIRLLDGRFFNEQDREGGNPVAIISQSLARKHFPGVNPIGRRLSPTMRERTWSEIVGVVSDVQAYGAEREPSPQSYTPFAQTPFRTLTFVVRTDPSKPGLVNSEAFASALRHDVQAVDPEQPVARLEPVANLLRQSVARQRFAMTLFGVFSVLALLLAAIGIYGVMAYAVVQRTSEFGIRLALGAQPSDILRLVLGHGARLVLLGPAGGTLGALAAVQLLQSLLYQTPARDPLVFIGIAALLAAVAAVACLLPARRATRVDPMVALRAE